MQEVWKDVKGYEELYKVSNLGNILNTKTGRVLKPQRNTWGYVHVMLHKDGTRKTIVIHKMVADAFIPKQEGLTQVNHKDENKANNLLDNLERCTASYNISYGTAPARRTEKKSKPVMQLDQNNKTVNTFKSAREAHELYGYCYKHISDCCLGRRNTHAGYVWKFV